MNQTCDRDIKYILFICSANICRSVMAEALLKVKLKDAGVEGIFVESAGISASNGSAMLANTENILQDKNIYFPKKSQAVTLNLLQKSDLILTMTRSHKYMLLSQIPTIKNKLFTLKEYVGATDSFDVNIPAENQKSYRDCIEDIKSAIDILVEKIMS